MVPGAKAYQELKRKTVTLELPPATVLTETVLMEDLNIGRTPVREASQRLSHEDLVVIEDMCCAAYRTLFLGY